MVMKHRTFCVESHLEGLWIGVGAVIGVWAALVAAASRASRPRFEVVLREDANKLVVAEEVSGVADLVKLR